MKIIEEVMDNEMSDINKDKRNCSWLNWPTVRFSINIPGAQENFH